MFKKFTKRLKDYSSLIQLWEFFYKVEMKPAWLIVPAFLGLIAAVLEGVTFGLLIPTVKGIIQGDFGFVREIAVLKNIINAFPRVFGQANTPIFVFLVLLIFSAAVLKNIFQYFSSYGILVLIRKFANKMRKHIYRRYLSFGKLFFDHQNTGHLYQILVGHTARIANEMRLLERSIYSLFVLIAYFVVMVIISWKLTLFVLIIFPVLHFSLKWIMKKIKKTSVDLADSLSQLSSKISNALSCILLVKAYTSQEKEKEWFNHASNRLENVEKSMEKKRALVRPMQEGILLFMVLLLIAAVAYLLVKEKTGELAGYMVFFVLLRRSMSPLGVFNNIQSSLASIKGPVSVVLKIFDDKGKYFVSEGKKEFKGLKKEIKFNHLTFSFPRGTKALEDINFSVPKGRMLALVGSSGAGKTTLINLLLRFYDCPPETIKMDETDIREFTLEPLRSHIALVGQETLLFNAPLRINIAYGLKEKVSNEEIWNVLKKAQLYNFVRNLPDKLNTEIGDRGVQLSGGEKQRVAIARAMLKKAEIILLDEATSSLDSITERLIQKALNELVRNKTSIVIAHRLSTIRHADKIVVIESGRIAEEGSIEELLKKRNYFYRYWQHQKFY